MAKRLLRLALVATFLVAGPGIAAAQEAVTFDGLPGGFYSGTEGDPGTFEVFGNGGSGPILIRGFNPRFGLGVNAAAVFDTAEPAGQDVDLRSPSGTCDSPGLSVGGVGVAGGVGMPFENCPAVPMLKALVVDETLVDRDGDRLIDSPGDEELSGFKESVHLDFDFSALGSVSVVGITILDTEGPGPMVQLFGFDNVVIASFQLPATGDNGLAEELNLGPTSGVVRMNVALQGSGAVDNIIFNTPQPGIDISKRKEGDDLQAIARGGDARFTILVRNTGSETLTNVEVTDPLAPQCDRSIGELGPGQRSSYVCTVENVTQGFINEACVSGELAGGTVEDCDPSTVEIVEIDIRKQEEGLDTRTFTFGSDVPFEIVVTNTGETLLRNVMVTDAQVPGCDMTIGEIGIGQSFSYTCVAENVTAEFINEACVSTRSWSVFDEDCDPSKVELVQECALSLDKQCVAQLPPSGDLACEAKIAATTLRYIGPSVDGATVVFEGGDGLATYVDVDLVSGVTVLTDPSQNGFTVDGQPGDMSSKMTITLDGDEEEIHTSCSTPYVAGLPAPLNDPKGDPSPNWFVINFVDKNGAFVEDPPPPAPSDLCQIPSSDGVLCDKRPTELGLRFNGGDCSQSDTTQDSGKWECSGDAGAGPVRILAFNGGDVYLDEDDVASGGVISLLASTVDRDDLDSEIEFEIYDGFGNLVQEVRFHTSCSQDLRIGDKFGALEVVRFVNSEQGTVQSGGEVEYLYTVENVGIIDAFDLFVTDDPLGDIGGISQLAPGESVTLSTTTFITETITNIGDVVGFAASGLECSATDTATVEIVPPPPPPPGSCDDGKPVLLEFEYTGDDCDATTNDQEGKVECTGDPGFAEPIQIVITKDENDISVDPTDESIAIGDTFAVFRNNGDKLKSETQFEIRQGGQMLQELVIHTSCSKDLDIGDQFGGVILRNFVPE